MAVDTRTLASGEGPECVEAGDANCQLGGPAAREYQRLSWASDFFPASHWTSSASSSISSGRCNSRDSSGTHTDRPRPVIGDHATPVRVPANEAPEEAPISSTLVGSDDEAKAESPIANQKSSKKNESSKVHPEATSCTRANSSSEKGSQLLCERHPPGSAQARMKASLVCGPLAVQETLSERQLCIEKRMMELRQQNRRRLQRRQQEAKMQQQQRLKEQQAVLLARRHRLKIASLWKERGMAAAARSSSLLRESNPDSQSQAATSMQKVSRNAEELLTALVISESVDLQHVEAGSDKGQCTAGGLASEPAGCTHVYSHSQGFGAALPSVSLCTSREQPGGEARSSSYAQKSRELQALTMQFLHAPSRSIETETTFAAPQCYERQGTSLKATSSAESCLHLSLHQPTRCPTDSQNTHAASRPFAEAPPGKKSCSKLQAPSPASCAVRRRAASQQQTQGVDSALHKISNEVLRGGHPHSLKPSKICSFARHQVRRFRLLPEPTRRSLAPLCRPGTEGSSSGTTLVRAADKIKSEETLAQGNSFSKPSRMPAQPISTDKGEAGGQHTRQDQPPQAVVVVSDHQLKKVLELKLKQQQAGQHGQAVRYPGFTAPQASAALQEQATHARDRVNSPSSQIKDVFLADDEARKAHGEPGEASKGRCLNDDSPLGAGQQVEPTRSSEQQLQIPMPQTPVACDTQYRKRLSEQVAREAALRANAREEIMRDKDKQDNQRLFSDQSEAERQEALPPDGATRAQAAGLKLVRITRHIGDSSEAKNIDQASLELEHGRFGIASRPAHGRTCCSRLRWQAARESQLSGVSEGGADNSTYVHQPIKSISLAEQQQGGQEARWTLSHASNEASESRNCTSKHQEENIVTYSSKSSALGSLSPERTRQWNPTSLAVQALEEAQQMEEKRLLLLEVSHHAIENQAKNRRKELALLQWLQQQHSQEDMQEAGDSRTQHRQQQENIASAQVGTTAEEEAHVAGARSGKSEPAGSLTLRASHCHQQTQLRQNPKEQQVRRSSRLSPTAPLLLPPRSSPVRSTQRAASFSSSQHPDAPQASCPNTDSRSEESTRPTRLVRNHSVDNAQSRLVQQQNPDELLQQQQALLQQLLQQCLLGSPAKQSQTKENEPANVDSESCGLLWGLKALAHMQRTDVLQALQRLLLLPSKIGPQDAGAFEVHHDSRQTPMQGRQQQQKCQKHVSAEAASAAESSAAQKRCASRLPTSSYRMRTSLSSLRFHETKTKEHKLHQRQQDKIGKSLQKDQAEEEMTSGPDAHSTRPEVPQALNDNQQMLAAAIIGPLLVSMLQYNSLQQKRELGERQMHGFQQASKPGKKTLEQTSNEDPRVE
ncbi:hypothetical protein ACSSS7_002619 [Eimeria intestinalis]